MLQDDTKDNLIEVAWIEPVYFRDKKPEEISMPENEVLEAVLNNECLTAYTEGAVDAAENDSQEGTYVVSFDMEPEHMKVRVENFLEYGSSKRETWMRDNLPDLFAAGNFKEAGELAKNSDQQQALKNPTISICIPPEEPYEIIGETEFAIFGGKIWKVAEGVLDSCLCNFYIKIESVQHIIQEQDIAKDEYNIEAFVGEKKFPIVVEKDKLSKLGSTVLKSVAITRTERGSEADLNRVLRVLASQQIEFVPAKIIYKCAGWTRLASGEVKYLYDGVDVGRDAIVESNMNFPYKQHYLRESFDLLCQITQDKAIAIPMVSYAFTGLLTHLFIQAKIPVRFVLFLNGRSGTMKTTVAKEIFAAMQPGEKKLTSTFKDTSAGIEASIMAHKDVVVIVDDYHPAEARMKKEMAAKLEEVFRFFGDGIGKNRSNIHLDSVKGKQPLCLCAITGEDIDGSLSSMLRTLVLNIDTQTFRDDEGAKRIITMLQNDPTIVCSIYAEFVNYIGNNYVQIVEFIGATVSQLRRKAFPDALDLRLVDMYTQLYTTWQILTQWLCRANVMTQDEKACYDNMADEALYTAVKNSVKMSEEVDPVGLYLQALNELIGSEDLKLADSYEKYNHEHHDGWREPDVLILKPHEVYKQVIAYLKDIGKDFPVKYDKIHKRIQKEQNLLNTDKDSGLKKTTVAVGKRVPMLHVREKAFQDYIAQTQN